jgi:SAM-dependent methyltransferase
VTDPSDFDNKFMPKSREFISKYRQIFLDKYFLVDSKILDIGNQDKYELQMSGLAISSLDIAPDSQADYIGDITTHNTEIPDSFFDGVICMEVLEHTVDPFAAISEISRIMKPGGYLFVTSPLNARIHGPIPDCWRFTEFGLKLLLRDFEMIQFEKFNTPDRNLFPLHYATIVRKQPNQEVSDPRKIKFEPVD